MFRFGFTVAVLAALLLSFTSVMAAEKEKQKEGRGIVQSVDTTAKTFTVKTQGKKTETLTLKYTDATTYKLDKADSKLEDVLKEKAQVRYVIDAAHDDTVTQVTAVTEAPKKEGGKKGAAK